MTSDVQDAHDPFPGEFFRAIVGSTLSGVNTDPDGDRDEMGILVEPPSAITGLERFDQHVYRTQPDGSRSGRDDLDLTVYGLQKFMSLAVKGNPNILQMFFVPDEFIIINEGGLVTEIQDLAADIMCSAFAEPYLGYLTAQKERLLGLRGGRRVNRTDNEQGYDGKYAAHMIRLGLQGVELVTTGRITLPMPEAEREYCRSVRRGEVTLVEVLRRSEDLEDQLTALSSRSSLRPLPDLVRVNDFLHSVYMRAWTMHTL